MGFKDLLDKKKKQWKEERDERKLQETGYKMAYKEAYKEEMAKAVKERVSTNARAAAKADAARRFPGRGQGGGRAASFISGLNAASQGAMGSMGFGPPVRAPVSRKRTTTKKKHKKKRSRSSTPRQPQEFSFW